MNPSKPSGYREAILVIHGLGGHWLIMSPLCYRLRKQGYQVRNWGYRSLWGSIEQHATRFRSTLDQLDADPHIDRIHIVSHSMGSIITRVALSQSPPQKLARIVMLGPPNHGSHVATKFAICLGWLSTTLTEITDRPNSFVNRLAFRLNSRLEVGIIQAGTDLVVARACTLLEEASEYTLVPGFHSSILLHQNTAALVCNFLNSGSFRVEHSGGVDPA